MAPVWVTYEAGFFRKYGLDVELVLLKGGTKAVKAMIAGDVEVAQVGGAGVLRSRLKGADVVMIAGAVNTMPYQFIVDKTITRPEQLKGKAVGVSRFGGSSDFATRYAIEQFGLVPQKDVAILEIGSQPSRMRALQEGKVQGVMLSVPKTLEAKKLGFSALADLQMLGLEYQHTGLATTQALIQSRPELLHNVMRAYVEGIHYYKTHRKESLAIMSKYLKSDDSEALEETYEVMGQVLLPEKPYPTVRGIKVMLNRLAKRNPEAKTANPEEFVDLTFVKELDSSGFIDRLYQQPVPVMASRKAPSPSPVVVKKKETPVEEKAKVVSKPKPASREEVKSVSPVVKPVLPSPSAPAVGQAYTVRAGDTLSHLALRYYGSMFKWRKIYEANMETVKNPNFIYIGQKIMIPAADRS